MKHNNNSNNNNNRIAACKCRKNVAKLLILKTPEGWRKTVAFKVFTGMALSSVLAEQFRVLQVVRLKS